MYKPYRNSINLFAGVVMMLGLLGAATFPGIARSSQYSTIIHPYSSTSTHIPENHLLDDEDITKNYQPGITTTITQPLSSSNTSAISETINLTLTVTTTPTFTPSPTIYSPNETPMPYFTFFSYFPFILHDFFNPTNTPTPSLTPTSTYTPTPTLTPSPTPQRPEKVLFCDNINQPISIPDNDTNGIYNEIQIVDGRLLAGFRLYLDITHSYVGDLKVSLSNRSSGQTISVLDRPGIPSGSCSNNDVTTIFDDGAEQPADEQCASAPRAISGIYAPSQDQSIFIGQNAAATWRINVSDHYQNDIGWLNHWCLETALAQVMPAPTPTPTPFSFPSSAYVYGMSGQDQQLNLDCESRSAVDWAKHFGFFIDELDFLYNLPQSDDPEQGFVGNPDGHWGYIPPDDYGVHDLPVSLLLQDYGVVASSYHYLRWDDLRAEIAMGNPAIVWIIGGSNYNLANGIPHFYIPASTGDLTVVAPYEHTVIVVGYTPTTVTILNGSQFVDIPLDRFLDSWSVLQFMGILARP
jgi:subtilisin-like proprotein convertase family protein